ncbi:NADP-dependent oxidoreductase domain-containing protein [Melampsora americana]|nr:NADP-dependent oxidoreductase domain-containing protein [Melampsora americana]
MSKQISIKIGSGLEIPQIGLGTWLSKPNEVKNAVTHALKTGYRHLDLAKIYQNQDEVAAGIEASGIKREEIFLTSKLWNTWHHPSRVSIGLEDTLKELKTTYLDLYLIHWPVAFDEPTQVSIPTEYLFPKDAPTDTKVKLDLQTSLVDTWKEMIKLKETGKVKAIGVSNFTIEHLEGLINATGVIPSVNQIERHPLLIQPELIKYCQSKGIHITAYSPLGNNLRGELKIVDYPEVAEIAKKLSADPAQVLIAWGARGGISVIPKSVTPSRIESNFKQVDLSDEDYETLNKLGEKKVIRFNVPMTYTPKWDINVFNSEVEKSATHQIKIV